MLLNEHERPTRLHYEILAISWAGWVFDFYDLILYSFLLVPIGREFQFSRIELSWIFGSSLAATAVGGVAFGYLGDRFGRRRVLQWTILTYSAGTFLSGFAPGFRMLAVFRIITGLGVGGEWATGHAYIGETFPAKMRGRFGALLQTGAPFGVALASVVGGFLEPRLGWRACFLLSGLPALLVIAVRTRLPESDVWLRRRAEEKANPDSRRPNPVTLLLSPLYFALFLRCLLLTVFAMSAYWFTYTWLPGYLQEERHFTLAKSAGWILVTQLGALIGYASFGVVSDRYGRRVAFTAYSLCFASGLLMITTFWDAVFPHPGAVLSFMFLAGLGTGVWSGYGPLFAELFPTAIRNTAMGAAYNLARGVQFITPVVVAVIARRYGLSGGMSLAALFALATGAWIWTFEETKGKRIV